MNTLFGLSRNPEKYEAAALKAEQAGKTNKAIKNREKAARLRSHLAQQNSGMTSTMPMSSGYSTAPLSSGYTTTTMPVTSTYTTTTIPVTSTTSGYNTATPLNTSTGGSSGGFPFGRRSVSRYEQNALKWEQRGNFGKAQKNREKVWRMQNPNYQDRNFLAPAFYKDNTFQGYNLSPLSSGTSSTGLTGQQLNSGLTGQQFNSGLAGQQFNSGLIGQQQLNSGLVGQQQLNSGLIGQQQFNSGLTGQQFNSGLTSGQQINSGSSFSSGISGQSLNFNKGIPLSSGQQFNSGITSGLSTSHTNAPIVQTHVNPTIVENTIRPERIVEVQPIVHREIDAPQVRVIEKHTYETVPSAGPAVITRGAIVEETVRPRVIEEVQPVVHREVPAPFVERVEQHVTEHLVRPVVQTKEVVNGGNNFVAAGGAPIATGLGGAPITQQSAFSQQTPLSQNNLTNNQRRF